MSFIDRFFRGQATSVEGFRCGTCGEWHSGIPLNYAYDAPLYWDKIDEADRKQRGTLGTDTCVIDNQYFFVRGLVEIPVIETGERFRWGVWVSLSQTNFQRACELGGDPRLLDEPAYFGWLSNRIFGYPDTLNLKANVRWQNIAWRPSIELEPTDHALAVEQRQGITRARVLEIVEALMHDQK